MDKKININKIIKIIKEETDKDIDVKKTFEQNDFDSLDVVSIALGIEKNFNINIPDKDLKKIKTVMDVENYLNKKIKTKN